MSFPSARATALTSGLVVLICLLGVGLVMVNGMTLAGALAWLLLGLLPALLVLRAFGGRARDVAGLMPDSVDLGASAPGRRSFDAKGSRDRRA